MSRVHLALARLLFGALCAFAPHALAAESFVGSGYGAATGGGLEADEESYKTDLFTGAATLRIPIVVPQGTNGFQPQLALSYSSSRGIGWVGQGWDLELPSIRRMTKFGIPKYSDDATTGDHFQLDDDRLVRDDAGIFHTMRESFQRIEHLDSGQTNDRWIVQRPDGTVLTFGDTDATRIRRTDTPAGIYRWLISEAKDRNGNWIRYEYDKTKYDGATDEGTAYPKKITYGYQGESSGSATLRAVEFTLSTSAREDETLVFTGGVKTELSRRLERIEAKRGSALVTRYELLYYGESGVPPLPLNQRSLLRRVDRIGANGSTTIQGDTYSYAGISSSTWTGNNTSVENRLKALDPGPDIYFGYRGLDLRPGNEFFTSRWSILDIDGDAASDLVWSIGNVGSGESHGSDAGSVFINVRESLDQNEIPGYLPSEALPFYPTGGSRYTASATPVTGDPNGVYQPPVSPGHAHVAYVDVNGDGRTDVVDSRVHPDPAKDENRIFLNIDGKWKLRLGSEPYHGLPANVGLEIWQANCGGSGVANIAGKGVLEDVNGDGLADVLVDRSNSLFCNTWAEEKVYLNNGTGWDPNDPAWSDALGDAMAAMGVDVDQVVFFDLNGDGLVDLGEDATKNGYVDNPLYAHVWINTGSRWEKATTLGFVQGNSPDNQFLGGDIDGDGLPDQIGADNESFNAGMKFVEGAGFDLPGSAANGINPLGDEAFFDINGDGIGDVVRADKQQELYALDLEISVNSAGPAGLLTRIDKAHGGTVEVSYRTTSATPCVPRGITGCSQPTDTQIVYGQARTCVYPLYEKGSTGPLDPADPPNVCRVDLPDVPMRVATVESVRTLDRPPGNPNDPPIEREDRIRYGHGAFSTLEREFRGFGFVTSRPEAPPDYTMPGHPIERLGVLRGTIFYQEDFLRGAEAISFLFRSIDDKINTGDVLLESTKNSYLFTRGDMTSTHLILGTDIAATCDPDDPGQATSPPAECALSLLEIDDSDPFDPLTPDFPDPPTVDLPSDMPFLSFRNDFCGESGSPSNRDCAFAYMVLPYARATSSFDGSSSFERTSFEVYDEFGNVQLAWDRKDELDPSDDLATVREFAAPTCSGSGCTPGYLRSFPKMVLQYSLEGAVLSREQLSYDDLPNGEVARGDLSARLAGLGSPADDAVTLLTYPTPSLGLPESVSDPLLPADDPNRVTSFVYDDTSRTFVTQRTRGGLSETITYDPTGAPPGLGIAKTITDSNGQGVTLEADPFGRPTSRSGPLPITEVEARSYDLNSGYTPGVPEVVVTTRDGAGHDVTTSVFIDGLGRTTFACSTGLGAGATSGRILQRTMYDLRGRVSETSAPYFRADENCNQAPSDPNANVAATALFYDARGRARFVEQRDGGIQETEYAGLITELTDAEGRQRDVRRNGAGSVVSVTEHDGASAYTTTYRYDPLQQLRGVCDAFLAEASCPIVSCSGESCSIPQSASSSDKRHFTRIVYDDLGRRESIEDPDMGVWSYAYDGAGNLLAQEDARGVEQTFVYDAVHGRLECESPTGAGCNGADVSYTYGDELGAQAPSFSLGRLVQATTPEGTYAYQYDFAGRVKQEKLTLPGGGPLYAVDYTYDWLDRILTTAYPDGETLTRDYDLMGVEEIRSSVPGRKYVDHVEHDAEGRPGKVVYGNQVTRSLSYEPSGYLSNVNDDPNGASPVFLNRTYGYDKTGKLLSMTDGADSGETLSAIAYDGLGRLKQATRGTAPQTTLLSYGYDPIGNLTSKENVPLPYGHATKPHAVWDAANPGRFVYDANGNLTSRNGQALAYDARSRLVSVTGSGAPPVRMGYDATGERARLERGASLSHFLGPDFEIRSIRPPTGAIRYGRRFAKTIRLGGTIVAVVESRTGLGASAPPSADSTRRWILVVGGAPAAVGLLLLALVLAQRRRQGLPLPQPALAGLVAVVFYLGPTGAALAAIPTGDLNADGALDGADVMLGQRIVDGTLTPNPVGDVSPLEQAPDGTIDSSDVLLLTRGAGEEDVDGDGLSDSAELADGTSPFRRDTDQDGVLDGAESGGGPSSARLNPDQDDDGIVDGEDGLATTAAAPFEVLYVHADHLGGTAIATNDSGAVVRKVKYGIFGEVRGNSIETGAPATTPDPREKFTGQRYDASTSLYYYGARYYDPALGRFIQADPIVPEPFDPQSFNRYSYVGNDPLNWTDPTGTTSFLPDWRDFDDYDYINSRDPQLDAISLADDLYDPPRNDFQPIDLGFRPVTSSPDYGLSQRDLVGLDNLFRSSSSEPPGVGGFGVGDAAMIAGGFIPGVGEVLDAAVLAAPESSGFERGAAAVSLGLNALTAGVLPNFGGIARVATDFVTDATVISRGKVLFRGTADLRATVEGIESGALLPRNVFRNGEGLLPNKPSGYYQEFVHPTPGASGAGPQRIIRGQGGELYYTPDHYQTFIPLN